MSPQVPSSFGALFIMRPHPNDFYRSHIIKNLINQAMLDVDTAGAGAGKIAHKLFIWRRSSVRIVLKNLEQLFRLRTETRLGKFLGIFLSLFGKRDFPFFHHPGSVEHLSTGVFSPFFIEAFMPGIDWRNRVS